MAIQKKSLKNNLKSGKKTKVAVGAVKNSRTMRGEKEVNLRRIGLELPAVQ